MKTFGTTYKSAGENIAMEQRSAAEVMDAWMKSTGHKANVLNPSYTHIIVGLSGSGYYWIHSLLENKSGAFHFIKIIETKKFPTMVEAFLFLTNDK